MNPGNRIREIYRFYTRKTQARLKIEYLEHFGYHNQTFQNKLNPNSHHHFTSEELLWFEKWASLNGGPPLPKVEEQKEKASA